MALKIIELLCNMTGITMIVALLVNIFMYSSSQSNYSALKEDISYIAMFIAIGAGILAIILLILKLAIF